MTTQQTVETEIDQSISQAKAQFQGYPQEVMPQLERAAETDALMQEISYLQAIVEQKQTGFPPTSKLAKNRAGVIDELQTLQSQLQTLTLANVFSGGGKLEVPGEYEGYVAKLNEMGKEAEAFEAHLWYERLKQLQADYDQRVQKSIELNKAINEDLRKYRQELLQQYKQCNLSIADRFKAVLEKLVMRLRELIDKMNLLNEKIRNAQAQYKELRAAYKKDFIEMLKSFSRDNDLLSLSDKKYEEIHDRSVLNPDGTVVNSPDLVGMKGKQFLIDELAKEMTPKSEGKAGLEANKRMLREKLEGINDQMRQLSEKYVDDCAGYEAAVAVLEEEKRKTVKEIKTIEFQIDEVVAQKGCSPEEAKKAREQANAAVVLIAQDLKKDKEKTAKARSEYSEQNEADVSSSAPKSSRPSRPQRVKKTFTPKPS